MDTSVFVRGLMIGFSIAAPVGPIGVLVIRRTLAEGRLAGLITGLGAATADAIYGLIGALGLTLVTEVLVGGAGWLQLLGGLFLCYLGIRTFLTRPATEPARLDSGAYARAYLTTLALTLTNPATILSFAAVFAGLGLGTQSSGYDTALILVLGVFIGSACWWLLLSAGVSLARERVTPHILGWINRISGVVILAFGLAVLVL